MNLFKNCDRGSAERDMLGTMQATYHFQELGRGPSKEGLKGLSCSVHEMMLNEQFLESSGGIDSSLNKVLVVARGHVGQRSESFSGKGFSDPRQG